MKGEAEGGEDNPSIVETTGAYPLSLRAKHSVGVARSCVAIVKNVKACDGSLLLNVDATDAYLTAHMRKQDCAIAPTGPLRRSSYGRRGCGGGCARVST